MMRASTGRELGKVGGLMGATLLLQGCGGWQSILDPHGPGPARVESLWWLAIGSTGVLAFAVIVGLLYAVRRSAHAPTPREGGTVARNENRFILLAGGAFPALFLLGFLVVSVRTGSEIFAPPEEPILSLEVTGHMFWWEVRYPDHGVTTANEIRIPSGGPVRVEVTSADVIHSFWVPQLAPGKIDMMPQRRHTIWMQADEPGLHRGQCTEFCGVQHALMSLLVVATPQDEFDAWMAMRTQARPPPDDPLAMRGMTVFIQVGCGSCHAIEGVSRPLLAGNPGPDLTDLAQRRTLGALTIENNRANLAAWIVDPHQFKPGVRMPPHRLDPEDLEALVTYLETLR